MVCNIFVKMSRCGTLAGKTVTFDRRILTNNFLGRKLCSARRRGLPTKNTVFSPSIIRKKGEVDVRRWAGYTIKGLEQPSTTQYVHCAVGGAADQRPNHGKLTQTSQPHTISESTPKTAFHTLLSLTTEAVRHEREISNAGR
jgi:hypothetical protein